MKFEWDEKKRRINLKKHGIDFVEVRQLFDSPRHTIVDDRFDYEEIRFLYVRFIKFG